MWGGGDTRRPTRPTKGSVERRIKAKKVRGEVKGLLGKVEEKRCKRRKCLAKERSENICNLRFAGAFTSFLCGVLITFILMGGIRPDVLLPPIVGDENIANYTDFLTVTLTALAVILAGLAVFIAILAIWGYNSIKKSSEISAQKRAERIISDALTKNGVLYNLVVESLGAKGDLFERIKEEIYAGVTQWDSSGYQDPDEKEEEGAER